MPSKTNKQTKTAPTDASKQNLETRKTTKTKAIIDAFNAPKKLARKQAELEQIAPDTSRNRRAEPVKPAPAPKKIAEPVETPTSRRGRGRPSSSARTQSPQAAAPAQAAPHSVVAPVLPDPSLKAYRIDLHMHTPASHDYEQMDKTYLDILQKAERRGLDMIAFTDHNSSNGYRNMLREISELELLERLERIRPDELAKLEEYRRLLKKIVVLPGFEFTATFGFHILGIFPPDKPLREIENVLVQLRVPNAAIDMGLTEAGATSDVLTAYRLIDEAGGIAIAAHANSSNGVSMRGLNLGGQTRIAFTQDPHLHAIEFTDLDRGKRSSAMLFKGTRAEYPRLMHVLQGSDAHRLTADPKNPKRLGIGERPTEVDLHEISFAALRNLFLSNEFGRVRPVLPIEVKEKEDSLQLARIAGESATMAFHPVLPKKGDKFAAILRDVCAMANNGSGNIYVGCEAGARKKVAGIAEANAVAAQLSEAILRQIQPAPVVVVNVQEVEGKQVIGVRVSTSDKAPFAIENEFLVRDGAVTRTARRDEIVAIVRRVVEASVVTQQKPSQPQPNQQQPRYESRERNERPERNQRSNSSQRQPNNNRPQNERVDQRADNRNDRNDRFERVERQPRPAREVERIERNEPRTEPRVESRNEPRNTQAQSRPSQPNQQQPRRPLMPRPAVNEPAPAAAPEAQPPVQQPSAQQPPPARSSFVEQLQQAQAAIADRAPRTDAPQPPATTSAEIKWEGQPRNGVQVTGMEERDGVVYFTVRDVRNNTTVRNVTMKSARDLWLYAVSQYAESPSGPEGLDWAENKAVVTKALRAGRMRYDLAMRDAQGNVRVFFGVTDDGLNESWKQLVNAHSEDEDLDELNGSDELNGDDGNADDIADIEAGN